MSYPPNQPNQPPAGPNQPNHGYPSSASSADTGGSGYAPSNYSESAYGGQASAPAPQPTPAPAPPYGSGSYGSASYGYGAAPVGTPAQKKPTMGIVAFALTIVAAILYCVFAAQGATATVDLFNLIGTIDVEAAEPELTSSVEAQNLALALSAWFLAQAIPAVMGLVGFILGIVAAAQNKGRVWGILAIVLGVIGPLAGFMVYSYGLAPIANLM